MCRPLPDSTSKKAKDNKGFFFLLICIIANLALVSTSCVGNTKPGTSNTNKAADTSGTGKPSDSASSAIEFILELTPQEKAERAKLIESLPRFANAAETVTKFGFKITAFNAAPDARSYPVEGSLTGLIYMGEDSQRMGDHTFRVVFMGPTRDRVDTIRFQSLGIQTKQARQRLQAWANNTLTSLEKGKLPDAFIKKLYAGESVAANGVFNGFCNVQVLQRPINPSLPSVADRISIDLIFDKSSK